MIVLLIRIEVFVLSLPKITFPCCSLFKHLLFINNPGKGALKHSSYELCVPRTSLPRTVGNGLEAVGLDGMGEPYATGVKAINLFYQSSERIVYF